MIEEIYNLRKKNIKLLEELADIKKELHSFQDYSKEAFHTFYLEIINILDLLEQSNNNDAVKNALEKVLEMHQVKKIAIPSLMVSGMCETNPPTEFTYKQKVKKVLKTGYMKEEEIIRPFLVEVE